MCPSWIPLPPDQQWLCSLMITIIGGLIVAVILWKRFWQVFGSIVITFLIGTAVGNGVPWIISLATDHALGLAGAAAIAFVGMILWLGAIRWIWELGQEPEVEEDWWDRFR